MAVALLEAMRPERSNFDPVLSSKKISTSAPSFSMRKRTLHGEWQHHYLDTYGMGKLQGDFEKETKSVKEKAPAFSMRPRTPASPSAANPGPGAYTIPNSVGEEHPVTTTPPMWNFGSCDRDKTFNGVHSSSPKTPSPGDYIVTRDVNQGHGIGKVNQESVPSYSMRAKVQDDKEPAYRQKLSPRPGAHEYDVTHEHLDVAKNRAPKFTMRPKNSSPLKNNTPGPDTYATPSTVGNAHPSVARAPGWQLKGPERDKAFGRVLGHCPKTPSPGEYNVTKDNAIGRVDQEKVPSFSMRTQLQDHKEPAYRQKRSPRPGAHEYDVTQDHINLTRSKSPKFSMRSKPSTPLRSQSPAPGGYETPSTVANSHPSASKPPQWKFGSSNRENCVGRIMAHVPNTPSPQAYNVSRGIGRVGQEQPPSYTMRSRSKDRRSDIEFKEKMSPRPGAHEYSVTRDHVDLSKSKAPRYSMRPRSVTPDNRRNKSPGPGNYDVRGSLVRSSSAMSQRERGGAGFGTSKRFSDKQKDERIYTY